MTTDDTLALLSATLYALMARRKWNSVALSARSGVSDNTIQRILKGKDVRVGTIARLAQALDVPVRELFHPHMLG